MNGDTFGGRLGEAVAETYSIHKLVDDMFDRLHREDKIGWSTKASSGPNLVTYESYT